MKLGIFTVSAPEYEPLELMDMAAEMGYDGIEWRAAKDDGDRNNPSFWSGNRAGMTAQELIDNAGKLIEKAKQCNLEMPSVAGYITSDDLADVELHLKATQAIGAKNIRINANAYDKNVSYSKQLDKLRKQYAEVAKLAEKYDVRAVIETHMGQLAPTVFKARAVLQGLSPKHVGIMWDPGNQVTEGSEVYDMALDYAGEYLAEVHAKNQTVVPGEIKNGRQTFSVAAAPMRKGIVDWPAVINLLKKMKYDGWIFFEDFSTVVPTAQRLKENIDWFKQLIA